MRNGALKPIKTNTKIRTNGGRRGIASPQHRRKTAAPKPKRARPNTGANARQRFEHFMSLARDAEVSGDAVASENYYQHAEHYYRVMAEKTAS